MPHAPGGSRRHEPDAQEAPHWSEPGQREAEVGVAVTTTDSVSNQNSIGTDMIMDCVVAG